MRERVRALGTGVVLLAVVGLIVLGLMGRLALVAEFTRWLLTPVAESMSSQARALRDRLEAPSDLEALRQENARLREEINRLTVDQIRFAEIELENRRLRALLNFVEAHPYYTVRGASVVGQVIGRDPSVVIDRLVLNVGELNGIKEGMPVVTDTGLVGRIVRVHKTTSEVLPITAPESAVNAIIQSTRLTGVVRGQHTDTLILDYIPPDMPVNVGDLVLTSGLGSVFPPKIVIGQVTAVERHDYDMFQRATIRPTVDFRRLEQVLVLVDFVPNPEVKEVLEGTTNEEGAP